MNRLSSIPRALFLGTSLLVAMVLLPSCEKWDLEARSYPEVKTLRFEAGASPGDGLLIGIVEGLEGNDLLEDHGHVWSLSSSPPPSLEDNIGQSALGKNGNVSFQTELSGLTPGRAYYYRAYAVYENEVVYEENTGQFSTEPLSVVFSIDSIVRLEEAFRAKVYTTVSNLPLGLGVSSYGITVGKEPLPEISSSSFFPEQAIVVTEPSFQFESNIILQAEKNYLRPFLQAGDVVYYGMDQPYTLGDAWTQVADFGGLPRYDAVGFSIGNKGYLGLGFNQIDFSDFWEYDPLQDSWTQKADFAGGARSQAVGFSIGDKGYVGLGYNYGDMWEYSPAEDLWTQKADFPGGKRVHAIGFSIGNKGYVGTGQVPSQDYAPTSDFWEYDPDSDSWDRRANFAGVSRGRAIGFSIGSRGYLGTGWNFAFYPNPYRKDFWEYDPESDSWAPKADFGGGPADELVAFSIGNKGYAGAGVREESEGFDGTDFWEYDPESDSWNRKADFGEDRRWGAVGFSVGTKGYIGTGYLGLNLVSGAIIQNDLWEYTPE